MLRRAWPWCCGRGLVTSRAEHVVVVDYRCSRWRLAHLRLSQRATGVRMKRTTCRSFDAHTIPRGVRAAFFLDWPLVYSLQWWGIYVRTVVSWCNPLAFVLATISHPRHDNDCVLACLVYVWLLFLFSLWSAVSYNVVSALRGASRGNSVEGYALARFMSGAGRTEFDMRFYRVRVHVWGG